MKIAIIVVRVLFGALLVFSSVVVLFNLVPQPPQTGAMQTFMEGMVATGYLLKLIKITELVCGIALIVGYFSPLATVVIFPITVNIFLVHAMMAPEGLPVGIFVLAANLFLAYAYRKNYAGLLTAKPIL
jgi:putative oxidoreductase